MDIYTIDQDSSIKDALKKIDNNYHGLIFAVNKDGEIQGLATDGDIRRALIAGVSLEDSIMNCINTEYLYFDINTPREALLKKLDSHIHFIPIIDHEKKLHSIVSKENLPLRDEGEICIRARAPIRLSFGGGGSDLTHFFSNDKGAVINSAASIYSHATMKIRNDLKIKIRSLDLGESIEAENLDIACSKKSNLGLIQSILTVVKPKYGFDLDIHSDFPVGSGLGGSATVCAVILGCFNSQRKDQWNQHELAEIAFQAERLHLGIAGGWQDQYASVFGGFNFIEFNNEQNIVNPIKLPDQSLLELEENLILCDTGIYHDSGSIHEDQKATMISKNIKKIVQKNVELTYKIKNYLIRGNFDLFGKALNEAWQLKRSLSSKITTPYIDDIYNGAMESGALGGKLLGAGGGGFFIFYVTPSNKHKLLSYLNKSNLKIKPFRFESEGLQVWNSRINANWIN